jgi:hypothetical protein
MNLRYIFDINIKKEYVEGVQIFYPRMFSIVLKKLLLGIYSRICE